MLRGGLLLLIALLLVNTNSAQDATSVSITPKTPFGTPDDWFYWTVRLDAVQTQAGYVAEVAFPPGVLLLGLNPSHGETRVLRPDNVVRWTLDSWPDDTAPTLAIRTRLTTVFDANVLRVQADLYTPDDIAALDDDATPAESLHSSENHAIVVASLPATGETPVWRLPLAALLALGGLLLLFAGIIGKPTQR